jgi:hypothetical protein
VARYRLKVTGRRHVEPSLLGALHDAARDHVLGVAFHGSRQPQRVVGRKSRRRSDVHDTKLTSCERAGLVEDDGRQTPRLLEPAPVSDEEPTPRAKRRRDGDDEWNRETERVRTADDEHGDDAFDRERHRRVQSEPDDERKDGRADSDDRQDERRTIGERLRA